MISAQVWKRYIDLEIHLEKHPDEDDDEGETPTQPTRAASLYERLLERTRHVPGRAGTCSECLDARRADGRPQHVRN